MLSGSRTYIWPFAPSRALQVFAPKRLLQPFHFGGGLDLLGPGYVGGCPSPFSGGSLSGGGSVLARRLDSESLVACVPGSVAGDLGKVFCPQ